MVICAVELVSTIKRSFISSWNMCFCAAFNISFSVSSCSWFNDQANQRLKTALYSAVVKRPKSRCQSFPKIVVESLCVASVSTATCSNVHSESDEVNTAFK